MVRVEDLMEAIQSGQSADDLAAEYAKALNEANARVKADEEAKAKIMAEAQMADARAVVNSLVTYIQRYIPEMELGEVTDADLDEATQFLVSAIDEVKAQLAPQLKLLNMLNIGGKKDPIVDFLKDMGL